MGRTMRPCFLSQRSCRPTSIPDKNKKATSPTSTISSLLMQPCSLYDGAHVPAKCSTKHNSLEDHRLLLDDVDWLMHQECDPLYDPMGYFPLPGIMLICESIKNIKPGILTPMYLLLIYKMNNNSTISQGRNQHTVPPSSKCYADIHICRDWSIPQHAK